MSFSWLQWAKNVEGLPPPQKNVLTALADFFNDEEGYAWPSQHKLAIVTGYDRSTIIRALKALEAKGYITISKTTRNNGRFSRNMYKLYRVADSHQAESVPAQNNRSVLHKASPPCGALQHKHLQEPLNKTLNNTNFAKKGGKLSERQEVLAEKMAVDLMKAHPNEHHQLPILIKDCEDFLSSQQREEDWVALGNGLPNPLKI